MSSVSVACYCPWSRVRITGQSVSEEADLAQLNVEPDRRFIPVCHVCGSKAERIHEWHVRMVRDLNMANARVFIRARYRNIRCGVCERIRVEDLGFFEPHKRVTRRLAKYIHDLCKMLPVKQVADHLGLDWKTVKNVDKYFLEEEYGKTNYDDLKIIAVDEIALRKGHNYMTVILDYDSGRVVWVGKGRDSNTLKAFFEGMTEEQKAQVEAVAIDMWDPYIKAIQETLPGKVKIVFDLFHVVAAFSRLIDRVRISEYGKASEEDKKVIKGSKYLLLKNKKNIRKKEAREHLKKLLELNETISTMMILKDLLKRIWTYKYRGWVTKRLDEWCEMAQTIPYVYVHKFAKQLQRYSYGILNHCEYPLNTSRLEGCNNKIKVIKRQAYGFHDERYFGLKIIQAFDPT